MPSRSPWKRLSMVSRPKLAARAIWVSGFCGVTFTSKGPAARTLMASLLHSFLSVRHRRHLCGQHILETEVAQVPHALREQDAIQVIHFVLDHPGMKPLHGAVDRHTVRIEAL